MTTADFHDIGLYDEAAHGGAYVAEYAAPLLRECGWNEARISLCGEAIERHHEVRPQWDHGAEVELIRRGEIGRMVRHAARERPLTLPQIFIRRG